MECLTSSFNPWRHWPPRPLRPGERGRRGALGPNYPTARPWPAEVARWPEALRWRWATAVDCACYRGLRLTTAEAEATASLRRFAPPRAGRG